MALLKKLAEMSFSQRRGHALDIKNDADTTEALAIMEQRGNPPATELLMGMTAVLSHSSSWGWFNVL